MKRTLLAGGLLVALVASVLVIGLASAQTSTPAPTATGEPQKLADQFKAELAKQLGISVDQLNSALNNTQNALIDQAVADGKLTQSEADMLKQRVADGHNLFPFRGLKHGIENRVKVGLVDATAQVLGVDVSVVKDGLKNGNTLAQVANSHGMSTDDFKTKLLAQVKTTLDEKVSSGDITQQQADNLYNRLSSNIDNIVNHEPGGFPGGPFRHGPRFWFGGPDSGNDNDSGADNSPTIF